jgi:hypothetical protein
VLGEPAGLGDPLDDLVQRLRQDREEEIPRLVLIDQELVNVAELPAGGQLPLLPAMTRAFVEHIDDRPLGIGEIDVIDAELQHFCTR